MIKKFTFLFALMAIGRAWGQTPLDAVMMKQRESCFAIMYDQGSFDHYWEGTYLRKNETIATVNRHFVLPMIAIGVHDKINVIVGVPYVKTFSSEPNGGHLEGAKGFQDFSISVKGEILNKKIGPGNLALLATLGYSTPITNYLSDYRPYSIGFGANELSTRAIVHYKLDFGLYVRGTGSYLWRGQTQVERDYYYNNGSYYTDWMDVPSAWEYNAILGFRTLKNSLILEVNYTSLRSTSGDDIRPYNAAQPTNKVDADVVGGKIQGYFPKPVKGLGAFFYYYKTINGRNVGQYDGFGAGLTYQFKI